jgi:reductive dehalogenase
MSSKYHDILYNDGQLGPYPDHLLKRVDKPTNEIPGPIERRDERNRPGMSMSLFGESPEALQGYARLSSRSPYSSAIVDVLETFRSIIANRNPVAPDQAPIPEDPRVRARHLKSFGYFLGADVVGIGPLPQNAVYTHRAGDPHGDDNPFRERNSWPAAGPKAGDKCEAPFKYAIVFLMKKHDPTVSASNGYEEVIDAASFQAYTRLMVVSEQMAHYIRQLGWEAQASNRNDYLTMMPPVILAAGLGEVSRAGMILNPFLGTNFKASAVFTNMELETDGYADFGLKEYCSNCSICADQCPSRAITYGPQTLYNGYYNWILDFTRCWEFSAYENKEGSVCGRCTWVCPWHIPGQQPHDFDEWDGDLAWLHRRVDEQRDRIIADNYVQPAEYTRKWWFPLEYNETDDRLVVPTGKNTEKVCVEHPVRTR